MGLISWLKAWFWKIKAPKKHPKSSKIMLSYLQGLDPPQSEGFFFEPHHLSFQFRLVNGKLSPIVSLAARPPKNEHCIPQAEVSIHCSRGGFIRFRKCPSISKQVVPQGHGNHPSIPPLCVHFIIHLSSFRIRTLALDIQIKLLRWWFPMFFLILWGGPFFYVNIYISIYMYVYIYIYHTSLEKWLRKLCVGMSCIQVYGRSLNAYCVVQGLLLRKAGPAPGKMRDRGRVVTLRQKLLFSAKKTTGGLVFLVVFVG